MLYFNVCMAGGNPFQDTYPNRTIYCNWNQTWTLHNTLDECVWVACLYPPTVSVTSGCSPSIQQKNSLKPYTDIIIKIKQHKTISGPSRKFHCKRKLYWFSRNLVTSLQTNRLTTLYNRIHHLSGLLYQIKKERITLSGV